MKTKKKLNKPRKNAQAGSFFTMTHQWRVNMRKNIQGFQPKQM